MLIDVIAITSEITPSMSTRYHQNSNTISKIDLVTPVLATQTKVVQTSTK